MDWNFSEEGNPMKSNKLWLIVLVLTSASLILYGCGKKPETPEHGSTGADTVASLADGTTIAYTVTGGGYPAVVFVHGWGCNQSYWDNQVQYFSKMVKCVTVDLAGFGKSGKREDYTFEAFAGDVAAVVNKLQLERVILIGHSMGGPIIVEAAQMIGEPCFGIVGVDTYQQLALDLTDEQYDEWIKPFEDDFVTATETFVKSMFPEGTDSAVVARVMADLTSTDPEAGVGSFYGMKKYKIKDHLANLKQPIIAINTDLWPTDLEGNRKVVASSFELIMMPGYGHFPMLEDPQLFNKHLADAVQELVAKSRARG